MVTQNEHCKEKLVLKNKKSKGKMSAFLKPKWPLPAKHTPGINKNNGCYP